MYSRKILARSLLVAITVAGLAALQIVLNVSGRGGTPADSARGIVVTLLYLCVWAIEVPLLAPFFARFPLNERPWRRAAYYFVVGIAASLIPAAVNRELAELVQQWAPSSTYMPASFVLQLIASFLLFWMVAAIFQTVVARQKVRELEGQLAQAELQNLKSQLHPHFLFNTLHTISVLLRQDVEAANGVLLKLSDLLRISLDQSRSDQIPLQQELDFLQMYLAIEQTRFQERLRCSIAADGEARAALVPTLLLQPLVENAMRHGIAPRAAGGTIAISAKRAGDRLELRVDDDGAGLAVDYSARLSRGCGIRNTEGRLRALCGAEGRMEVATRAGGGVAVNISLPYRSS